MQMYVQIIENSRYCCIYSKTCLIFPGRCSPDSRFCPMLIAVVHKSRIFTVSGLGLEMSILIGKQLFLSICTWNSFREHLLLKSLGSDYDNKSVSFLRVAEHCRVCRCLPFAICTSYCVFQNFVDAKVDKEDVKSTGMFHFLVH